MTDNKILKIAVDATSLDNGGGLTIASRLWKELSEKYNVELHIIYSKDVVKENLKSAEVSCALHPVLIGKSSIVRFFIGKFIFVSKIIRRINPDVVWSTNFMVKNIGNIPQVVHQRNLKHFCNTAPLYRRFFSFDFYGIARDFFCKQSVARSSANIYISKYLKEKAEPYYNHKDKNQFVVYNPVESKRFVSKAYNLLEEKSETILVVSSVSPHKNNEVVFHVFEKLIKRKNNVNWKLIVVGSGDWSVYNSLLDKLNIKNRVHFLGYCNFNKLISLYKSSLCLLSTSKMEAFGNAPIEAMGFGCPVVVSNVTAIPEVIGDAGLLHDPDDSTSFCDSIIKLWDDECFRESQIKKGIRQSAKFDIEIICRQMFDIFNACSKIIKS